MNFIKKAIIKHKMKKKMESKLEGIRERMNEEKKLREKSVDEAMDAKIKAFKELDAPVLKKLNDNGDFIFERNGTTYNVFIGIHKMCVDNNDGKNIVTFTKKYCVNFIRLNIETDEAKLVLNGNDIVLYQYRKDKDVLLVHKFFENGELYVEMPYLRNKEVATLKVKAPMDFEIVNIHELTTLDPEEGQDEQHNDVIDYFKEILYENYNVPAYKNITQDINFSKLAKENDDFWEPFYMMLQYLVYCYHGEYQIKKNRKIEKRIIECNLKPLSTEYNDIEQNLALISYNAIITALYGEFLGRLDSICVIEEYYKLCEMRGCEFEKDEFIGGWTFMGYSDDKYEVVSLFTNDYDDYSPEDIYEYFLWLKNQYDHAQKPLLESNTWFNEYFTMIDMATGEFLDPDYLRYFNKIKGLEKMYQNKLLAQIKSKGWKVSTKQSLIEPSKELMDSFQP